MAPTTGLLDPSRAGVFFDGTVTDPQLDHPEGMAVHPDGSVWCGGERGQVFRVDPDGTAITEIACTGGFCLGLAFGPGGDLYVCDLKHAARFRVDTASGRVERFADGAGGQRLRIPNYPAFDADGRHLYVAETVANRVFRIPVRDDGSAFTANLGRWHLTRLEVGAEGLAPPPGGWR